MNASPSGPSSLSTLTVDQTLLDADHKIRKRFRTKKKNVSVESTTKRKGVQKRAANQSKRMVREEIAKSPVSKSKTRRALKRTNSSKDLVEEPLPPASPEVLQELEVVRETLATKHNDACLDGAEFLLREYGLKTTLFEPGLTLPQQFEEIKAANPELSHFCLVDLSNLVSQTIRFSRNLPRVQPFYAIKSCPNVNIMRTLFRLGVNFDCASVNEIKLALEVGASPSQIIFANPAKSEESLRFARERDVRMMTFDNYDEMEKIVRVFPEAELVLRMASNDSLSRLPFGFKFGASYAHACELIEAAEKLKANLIGISFHVGSGCMNSFAFIDTIHTARKLFDRASRFGFHMTLLDIGGGFPGDDSEINFDAIAHDITNVLDELFDSDVTVIAEPGRYMCHASVHEALKIYARREYVASKLTTNENGEEIYVPLKEVQYYVPDGVYGSFNCIMYDHYNPKVLPLVEVPDRELLNTTIFGPTCDSIDVIMKSKPFPAMNLGEWVYCRNVGAYTIAAGSTFNGFEGPKLFYCYNMKNVY